MPLAVWCHIVLIDPLPFQRNSLDTCTSDCDPIAVKTGIADLLLLLELHYGWTHCARGLFRLASRKAVD